MRRLKRIEALFPALAADGYEPHSRNTELYNCLGYVVGDSRHWWDQNWWWPSQVNRGEALSDAIDAYASQGFVACVDDAPEKGYEKIAIYAVQGAKYLEWTHAARLRPDGWWESKIGTLEDILHRTTNGLVGNEYGSVHVLMKRTIVERVRMQILHRKEPPQGLSLEPI